MLVKFNLMCGVIAIHIKQLFTTDCVLNTVFFACQTLEESRLQFTNEVCPQNTVFSRVFYKLIMSLI